MSTSEVSVRVIDWVHTLYPNTAHLDDYDSISDWWYKSGLMVLTRKLSSTRQQEVRDNAFSSIKWSAKKLVDVEATMTRIMLRVKPALDNILKPNWSESCFFIVVGSVGRMEANVNGDIDVNVCFDEQKAFERTKWELEIDEKIIQETKKDLLAKNRDLPDAIGYNLGIDDRLFLQFPGSINESSDDDDWEILANLLIGHHIISVSDSIVFESILAKFLSEIDDTLVGAKVANLLRKIIRTNQTKILKPKGKTIIDRANLVYKILTKSILLIVIIGNVEKEKWKLSYFRLAEIISEKTILDPTESDIIQQSVIDILNFRSTLHGSEYKQSEFLELLYNITKVITVLKDFLNSRGCSYLVQGLS